MKVCFLADARSPIARNWINHFIEHKHNVHIISSYPCSQDEIPGAKLYQEPVALSRFSRASRSGKTKAKSRGSKHPSLVGLRSAALEKLSLSVQHFVLPFDVRRHIKSINSIVERVSPDLVHAMRIPFEGILAAKALSPNIPLLISAWGNDFTLWAARNPLIARQTINALRRTDGLHTDCHRDLNLARQVWGFDAEKPAVVLPGAGGIDTSLFHTGEPDSKLKTELEIPSNAPVIINPRGFRGYVRNDIFFQAIPIVLQEQPDAVFVCPGMQANSVAENWVSESGIRRNVRLLPPVPHGQMSDLFRLACVAVSPSLHDGTPNTLLESMACGCLPVAFDIESVREWITDEVNGLLCNPDDSGSLARAIVRAVRDDRLRCEARAQNVKLIAERAEYNTVMKQAESFYTEVIKQKRKAVEV